VNISTAFLLRGFVYKELFMRLIRVIIDDTDWVQFISDQVNERAATIKKPFKECAITCPDNLPQARATMTP
jgi:hypothetical protein